MKSGIYEIVNTVTGNRYVGSAVDIRARWRAHRRALIRGEHASPVMTAAWEKHGESAFEFRKVLICSKENLLMYEQIVMDATKPEYNIRKVASSNLGVKYSEASKQKMRAAMAGKRKGQPGRPHTPESRAKLAASRIGKPSGMLGRKQTPETRAKIAAATVGKKYALGFKWTPEMKAKLSATLARKRGESA